MTSRSTLGSFEYELLSVLLQEPNGSYGAKILTRIEEVTDRSVSVGAIYTPLDRLETKGFVSSRCGEATPVGAEPPKLGEYIFGFISPADRLEAILGDLEENFRDRIAKHGIAAARRWYWFKLVQEVGFSAVRLLQFAVSIHDLLKKLGL